MIKLKSPSVFTRNIYINLLQHLMLRLSQLSLSTEKWNCTISRTGDKAGTRAECHQLLSPGGRAGEKRGGMRNQGRCSKGSLPDTGPRCSCCANIHLAVQKGLYCSESLMHSGVCTLAPPQRPSPVPASSSPDWHRSCIFLVGDWYRSITQNYFCFLSL